MGEVNRIRGNQRCFFWENAYRELSFGVGCCGILSKKIASIGVWGNGRFPQLNLPSALAVAKQVCSFLFAYRIVDLYFVVLANEKLYSCGQIWFLRMPYCSCEMWFLYFIKMLCGNVIASSKNNENSFLVRWQKLEVRVLFFFAYWDFLIGFLGCLMPARK